MQSYIPRTLDQVKDYERDMQRIASGKDTEGIYYQTIIGLKEDLSGVRLVPSILEKEEPSNSDNGAKVAHFQSEDGVNINADNHINGGKGSDKLDDEESIGSDNDSSDDSSDTDVGESEGLDLKDARKAHKKKVKEEKREARKNKIPKAVKKRKKKLSKDKKR
jgi:RIO kinase 1